MSERTYPGTHPNLKDGHFTIHEKRILETLSKEFFITNGGKEIKVGYSSKYKYLIISPTDIYKDMFNLDRELIVLFSPYANIEPRTLSVFDYVANDHSALRIEKICNVLISNDRNVEDSLNELIKSEPESQIIIPFYSDELLKISDSFFFRNRFKKYFYTRDLFAFEAPLKKDIYFFGRNDLIQVIINRYKSNENSGLFGLRKTGKTSLINGIERNLNKEGITPIVIDCQDTSFNQRRWFEALYYICEAAKKALQTDIELPSECDFTEKNASILAENFFKECRKHVNNPLLFIFDEIENISINTSPARHWSTDLDFVLFWQTLRSIFQRNTNLISYLLVGTNPSCIELPKINNVDNPIFNHFDPIYIPGFDVKDTREMVRKLGKRMGIKFEETIYSKLTEDFGGHPFLMRHVCSLISKKVSELDRPVTIGRNSYSASKDEFINNHYNYLEMIISILKTSYPDEYEMLTMLAIGDIDTFNEFSELHPSFTSHLIGYGLIKKDYSGFDFNIDAIKSYILNQSKYKRIGLSMDDMWAEISQRRNSAETKLRKLIKMLLQANVGASVGKEKILNIFGGSRKSKLNKLSYDDLFDATISEIYFADLSKILSKNWGIFKNVFEHTQKETFEKLEFINKTRADAHAKELTEEQFTYFRVCMSNIEKDLNKFM